MDPDRAEASGTTPGFADLLLRLNLSRVNLGDDWILVLQTWAEFAIDREPFWASTLLIQPSTSTFIHRVYGRTWRHGSFAGETELATVIQSAFGGVWACQGLATDLATCGRAFQRDFQRQKYPFDRLVSRDCLILIPEAAKSEKAEDAHLCGKCRELYWQIQAQPAELDQAERVPAEGAGGTRRAPKRRRPAETEGDSDPGVAPEVKSESEAEDSSLPLDVSLQEEEEEEAFWDENYRPQRHAQPRRGPRRSSGRRKARPDDFHESDSEYDPDEDKAQVRQEIDSLEMDEMLRQVQRDPETRNFMCDHCGKPFRSEKQLKSHWLRIKRLGDFTCKLCSFRCSLLQQLLDHAEAIHPDHMKEFAHLLREDVEMKTMKDPKKCSVCNMIFNGSTMLFRHRAKYHELGHFTCDECQIPILTRYDLSLHRNRVHNELIAKEVPSQMGMEEILGSDGKIKLKRTSFTCDVCFKGFKFDSGCDNHRRTKHGWGVFNCESCDLMCHYAEAFVGHLRNFHPEEQLINCPSCCEDISFTPEPNAFYGHYSNCAKKMILPVKPKGGRDHNKKRTALTFQCEECGRSFSSNYQFQAHLNSHRGIEKYKCDDCDYATNFPHVLADHRKIHLREKGLTNADTDIVLFHPCHVCGKQFRTMSSLREHVKVVHEGIRKEMPCGDCGMKFYSKGAFYNHKKKIHGFVSNRTRCGKRHFLTGTTIKGHPDGEEGEEESPAQH